MAINSNDLEQKRRSTGSGKVGIDDGATVGKGKGKGGKGNKDPADTNTANSPNYPGSNISVAATDTKGTTIGRAEQISSSKIDTTNEEQFRTQQMNFADFLNQQIKGTGGPSVASLQFRQAMDSNVANQFALARSGGGPLAMRQAQINAGNLNQQAANQAAQIRQAEAMNAESQLGNVLNQGRTADINIAENQAQLDENVNLANQGAVNNRNVVQGQLNTSIANTKDQTAATRFAASTNAAATVNAAGAAASASRYATDAANYRFNMGSSLGLDASQAMTPQQAAGADWNSTQQGVAAQQGINNNISNGLDNAGGSVAAASKPQYGKQLNTWAGV